MPARHHIVYKDKNIVGALPCFISQFGNTPFRRLDSSRPGFGGPLLLNDRKNTLEKLLKQASKYISNTVIGHRVISNNLNHLKFNKIFFHSGYRLRVDNINVVISLEESWNEIYSRMKKSRRYEIKRANTEEVIELEHTTKNIDQLIEINNQVLKKHKARLLKDTFYHALMDQFGEKAKIFAVKKDETVIGGYLLLEDQPKNTLRALLGGIPDIEKYSHHTADLFAKMFQYGKENEYKFLELGGVPTDIEDGLYRFKESLGGTDYPIYCWEKGNLIHSTLKTALKYLRMTRK